METTVATYIVAISCNEISALDILHPYLGFKNAESML